MGANGEAVARRSAWRGNILIPVLFAVSLIMIIWLFMMMVMMVTMLSFYESVNGSDIVEDVLLR